MRARPTQGSSSFVTPGLDPGGHGSASAALDALDHRVKPGGDGRGRSVIVAGLVIALLVTLLGTAWALDRLYPPDLRRLEATGTEVLDRQGRLLAMLPAVGGVWRFRATADDVSRPFLDLLVATEDRRFWSHPGVDPLAMARATLQMLRAGHVVSGGSTLAMQAARLLEPRPRTIRSKLIEAARALQLEWRYGRTGVLGIWLTLAPYGGNLEGVRAGARAWFGTSAAALDPAQAALLVALPRRPEALRPDRHPAAAILVRDRVLAEASGASVPTRRIAFPRHAPQALAGLQGVARTTLDLPLQAGLERLVGSQRPALPDRASVAILVADAPSREIRALVTASGALDLTRAVRSPGSALKPFLYQLGFQDGLIRPETALSDLPRHFGGYAPENFAHGHDGQVSAAEALRRSLNLPAVALLDQVGPLRFAEWLRAVGAKPRLPPGADPALPLALGGVGVTLREMAGLYAGLAGPGAGPLTMAPRESSPVVPQPEAARTVAAILTQPIPGGGPGGIAWKTGTSWGGRDAWALGFDRQHVVGVWVGRPDGTPMPGATGRSLAIPILARVFDLLPSAPLPTPRPILMAQPATPPAGLRLLFPPPDAILSGDGTVTLRAMGGRRPLTFLIDGAPLPAMPAKRETGWQPPGPGFYTVTVLDADGLVARAPVRVQ